MSASVILAGGFGMPPAVLGPLARTLRARGRRVVVAPLGLNVGCGEDAAQRLAAVVDGVVRQDCDSAVLVGHSRGGQLARVVAVRRRAAVAGLVTVATPWSIGPPDRAGVALVTGVVQGARRHGMLGRFGSVECATGACCRAFRADLRRVPPCPWTALWSTADRIAGGDARPPVGPTCTADLRTSHLGSVLTARGRAEVARAVAVLVGD